MTDEEWENVEKSLSRPYGHAKFMIDDTPLMSRFSLKRN
nr:MAG TPA: putative transposase [Caudoviricetes sp.]